MARITKRMIDAARPDINHETFTWDSELRGFGVRMRPSGSAAYIVQYRTSGRSRRMVIGKVGTLTPDEARKLAREALAAVAKGGDPAGDRQAARAAMTVAELCDWYLREAAGHVKASTLAMDRSRIECHVKPLLGRRTVKSLTTGDIEALQAAIAAGKTAKPRAAGRAGQATGGKGVAARTVGMFGTIMAFAVRHRVIEANPARGARRFADGKRTRFLNADELARLGKVMRASKEPPPAVAAIRALLLTGCRRNEVLGLRWQDVDVKARCLRLPDSKSGAQLRPIGATAAEFLDRLPRCGEWVFPAVRGGGHFVGLPRVLARLCAAAELADVTVHTLRHSFASVAAELGFSELTIAGLLGHRIGSVTARYSHVPDAALLQAASRVSARVAAAMDGMTEIRGEVVSLRR